MFENEEFQVYPQFLQEVSLFSILQILLGLPSLFPSSTSCHYLLSPLTIIKLSRFMSIFQITCCVRVSTFKKQQPKGHLGVSFPRDFVF